MAPRKDPDGESGESALASLAGLLADGGGGKGGGGGGGGGGAGGPEIAALHSLVARQVTRAEQRAAALGLHRAA